MRTSCGHSAAVILQLIGEGRLALAAIVADADPDLAGRFPALADITIERLMETTDSIQPAGTGSCSTTDCSALQETAESVTAAPLTDLIDERLTDPLRMPHPLLSPNEDTTLRSRSPVAT